MHTARLLTLTACATLSGLAVTTAHAQPIARCQAGVVQAQLAPNGTVTIAPALVDDSSGDANGRPVNLSVAPNMFDCSDVGSNPQTVTLTVTGSGPTATCMAQVNVVPPPVSVSCQDINVLLGESGSATFAVGDLVGASSGGCGSLMLSASASTFTCADLGPNSVTLSASAGGEVETCQATVTVVDPSPPVITCSADVTLPPSEETLLGATLNDAQASDNCGVNSITSNAPVAGFPLGTTPVTWTASDASGNFATCMQTVERDCCTPTPDMGVPMPDAGTTTDAGTLTDAGTAADAGSADQGSSLMDLGASDDLGFDSDQGADASQGDQDGGSDQAIVNADQGGSSAVDAGAGSLSGSSCAASPTPGAGGSGLLLALGLLAIRRRR
jgi:MYXO-CTERM domain-containing protein